MQHEKDFQSKKRREVLLPVCPIQTEAKCKPAGLKYDKTLEN